ncbi:cullin-3 [Rhizodiscina lignyota]|uniref:Cullin-3 n=1 Tax=Rhizodiscina lignyota TaxID=1504668 RepID=A0A9P4IID5_9PEZI|nr:cullin-3 [Rhizodiscina lignyota]
MRYGQGINGDDVDFESVWKTLDTAFTQIHDHNASSLSYEELYRFAYRLVLKKQGEKLYDKVKAFESTWLREKIRPQILGKLSPSLQSAPQDGVGAGAAATTNERREAGEKFLREVKDSWQNHVVCMNMLADVLMYMDRVYCTDNRKPNIYATAMNLFRDCNLFSPTGSDPRSPSVLGVLNGVILDQIQMERAGDVIDKSIIKSCIYMLDGLYESNSESSEQKLYSTSFEQDFLNVSREFYRDEGEKLLRESDAGGYCERTMARLKEEQYRCRTMLSDTTTPKIEKVVEEELIKNKIQEVIEMESGVRFMIDNERLEELGLVYQLEARVDEKKSELTKAIQLRVVEMGTAVNEAATTTAVPGQLPPEQAPKDAEAPANKPGNPQTAAAIKWVADVLELKDKFDAILNHSFQKDTGVAAALTRSFSEFINSAAFTRASEFISLFIDDNMKKGIRDKTETEIDQVLLKAITLVRYVQNKDMFEGYYKKHLTKRLLQKKSLSMDVEKDMVSRMKIELGHQFTQKMEGMFKDMNTSDDLTRNYQDYLQSTGSEDPKRVGLDMMVLTSMTWPPLGEDNEKKFIFPSEIDRLRKSFEKFYGEKHSGRKLTWLPHLGTADMRVRFGKMHEVNIPTYGMVILLLFNDVPSGEYLSYEEIQAKTNMPDADLIRNLQQIAVSKKTQFLKKEPMGREVNPSDKFCVNEKFQSKFLKLKVGIITNNNRVETDQEKRETEDKMEQHRGITVEAAIVRIMKSRKQLSHQQLILDTLDQVKAQFKPDVNMIKKRIESLIDREYLERLEESNPPAYKYLA